VDLTEEELIEMAISQSKLDQLTQRDGLTVQLRASTQAQGRPAPPPVAPPAPTLPPPAPTPPPPIPTLPPVPQ
jgi:hypothetical protein